MSTMRFLAFDLYSSILPQCFLIRQDYRLLHINSFSIYGNSVFEKIILRKALPPLFVNSIQKNTYRLNTFFLVSNL